MKSLPLFLLSLFLLSSGLDAQAQTSLFYEGFEGCNLPASWTTELIGNENATWYVGTPQNANADGSTIDGGCMLILDDDASGDNTPPWQLNLQTPTFDGRGYTDLRLYVDVHYRHAGDEPALKILVFDGASYHLLKVFQRYETQTGEQFSEYVTFTADLSFYASDNMAIRFEYNDGNTWAWWAGIDNIRVVGEGTATNLVLENFDDCVVGTEWSSQILQGVDDWQFGIMENPEAWAGASMNGTCFAFFDDDILGEAAPASAVRLISPTFDGATFADYRVSFDVLYRQAVDRERFSVGVIDPLSGEEQVVKTYTSSLGEEQLPTFVVEELDLSAFRSAQMQVFFQFDDAGEWGWWLGIDNVKISGDGFSNDLCTQAIPIFVDSTCLTANNLTAIFSAPIPDCGEGHLGGLWYHLEATSSHLLEVTTQADFNDVISVYKGSCEGLSQLICTNRDEHGFTGERLFFEAEVGQSYYILVSGIKTAFGRSRGNFCLDLNPIAAQPLPPPNDLCDNATQLTLDQDCVPGNNRNAQMEEFIPIKNPLSQADIWYSYSPATSTPVLIASNANFSDVITVFEGNCDNLTELASNEYGQFLLLDQVASGRTYFIQISNLFATLEGDVCMQLAAQEATTPINDDCLNATLVTVGGGCIEGFNNGADFSGPAASCDLFMSAGIWYRFIAPNSRKVRIKTGADFVHNLSIFSGNCSSLKEVYCEHNPITCEGYSEVSQLVPGESYYIRLSSTSGGFGFAAEGAVCLEILDGLNPPPTTPLSLTVSVDCLEDELARLLIQGSGGAGAYQFQGNTQDEILVTGDPYLVVLKDNEGCEQAISGVINCTENACSINSSMSYTPATCPDSPDGMAQVTVSDADSSYTYFWSNGANGPIASGLSPGIYSVTITAGDGCAAVSFVNVGPQPIAMALESVSDETIAGNDGAIDITISGGTPPYRYFWLGGGIVVGTTEDLAGLKGGNYVLQVIDANNCNFVSSVINIGGVVANATRDLSEFIQLQPNPNRGTFILSFQLNEQENVQIQVFDVAGQVIQSLPTLQISKDDIRIDLKGHPAGLYLVKLHIGDRWVTKRVVVL